jgi:hypothetical protein
MLQTSTKFKAVKMAVFWGSTLLRSFWRFGGTYCLFLQGISIGQPHHLSIHLYYSAVLLGMVNHQRSSTGLKLQYQYQ